MSKIQWKGSTLLAPVPPALVSCGTMDRPQCPHDCVDGHHQLSAAEDVYFRSSGAVQL